MKTTLDIPNDLYREAKATAALERILVKDLVTEGLRMVLAARGKGKQRGQSYNLNVSDKVDRKNADRKASRTGAGARRVLDRINKIYRIWRGNTGARERSG